jgi:hypothetical protein
MPASFDRQVGPSQLETRFSDPSPIAGSEGDVVEDLPSRGPHNPPDDP